MPQMASNCHGYCLLLQAWYSVLQLQPVPHTVQGMHTALASCIRGILLKIKGMDVSGQYSPSRNVGKVVGIFFNGLTWYFHTCIFILCSYLTPPHYPPLSPPPPVASSFPPTQAIPFPFHNTWTSLSLLPGSDSKVKRTWGFLKGKGKTMKMQDKWWVFMKVFLT